MGLRILARTVVGILNHPPTAIHDPLPMDLTERQKKHLRRLAHPLNPVVLVGQDGDSAGVVHELDVALGAHELVKVRARVGDRDERNLLLDRLALATRSQLIQRIGNVGVFYRAKREPRIMLPDA